MDEPGNLAWSCHRCNLLKGTNLAAVDPDSSLVIRLLNPRTDAWNIHFSLRDGRIIGLTPCGRATAWLLQMNTEQRIRLRRMLTEDAQW